MSAPQLEIRRGMKGDGVRYVQEWLSLHGLRTQPDGAFGPATEACLREFQAKNGAYPDGICNAQVWALLEAPLTAACTIWPAAGMTIPDLIIETARQHLVQHPREVGGQNMGPWVRYYTRGSEGPSWPWCAGYVSAIIFQAFQRIGQKPQRFKFTLSCDNLMEHAMQAGTVIKEPVPGCIFLVRGKRPGDWVHTGIVTGCGPDIIRTIEGNTNDEGSREGYEVCAWVRASKDKDYVLVAA